MIVYKYLTADRIDVLEGQQIRFTQPSALNDPFECLPNLSLYRANLVHRLLETEDGKALEDLPQQIAIVGETLFDLCKMIIDEISKSYAFLSLSRTRDSTLMWSHYADSHKGFVVGFESNSQMFRPNSLSDFGLMDIEYTKERWILPEDGLSSMSDPEVDSANLRWFFSKCVEWKYESEIRLMTRTDRANSVQMLNGTPVYLFDFESEMVREVIVGFRMNEIQKTKLIRLTEKFPKAKLFNALLDPEHFGIEIQPYK